MRIENLNGSEIASMDDWAKLYDTPRQRHQWKRHRSAHSVAEFLLNCAGADAVQSRVSEALECRVRFDRAVPEYEVRFDEYGHGRVHDLGIFGTTDSGASVFVGVEAKVDEPFGLSVHDAYLAAKARQIAGVSTNAPERIEKLLALHFSSPDVGMFGVRYQLLYATAGTLAAPANIHVLYIMVFKTKLYDESVGADNYRDYIQFMARVGARSLGLPTKEAHGHELVLGGKRLVCLHEYFGIES